MIVSLVTASPTVKVELPHRWTGKALDPSAHRRLFAAASGLPRARPLGGWLCSPPGVAMRGGLTVWCGLNCVSPSSSVEVLTARTSECDLIWRHGLCRGDPVKVGCGRKGATCYPDKLGEACKLALRMQRPKSAHRMVWGGNVLTRGGSWPVVMSQERLFGNKGQPSP